MYVCMYERRWPLDTTIGYRISNTVVLLSFIYLQNWLLQLLIRVSHIHVVKVDSGRWIFGKLYYGIFIYTQSFCQKTAKGI